MINKIVAITLIATTLPYAKTIVLDSDLDGVSDSQDQCPNTPFLNEVDARGCTVNILTLPNQGEHDSLILSMGYGYSNNDDLKNRELQHNTNMQLSYYHKDWSYILHTGYYTHSEHNGILDTTLKIKKRFHLHKKLIAGISTGVTLPTHDYIGNKTDLFVTATLHYYVTEKLSAFMGYTYTYNGDQSTLEIENEEEEEDEKKYQKQNDENVEKVQNMKNYHKAYLGLGYFFSPSLYANISYRLEQSKFAQEHNRQAFASTIYYKIDKKWFSTLSYRREFADEDLHDNILFKIGYHIW